jgi:hypothetical protein
MLRSDYDGKEAVESVRSVASTMYPLITQRTQRVRAALRARSFSEVAPSPTMVTIELDGCNGRTVQADSGTGTLQRFFSGVGHPSRSEWLRIVDEVPQTATLRFSGGEPLMSPHLEALLFEADSRGLDVEIVTDGRALEEHAPVVYGLGVARVRLVFFGLEDGHNRTVGDPRAFEKAVRGALALRGLKYGTSRPHLIIHLVVKPCETGWVTSMVECSQAIGADEIVVQLPTCSTEQERKGCRGVRIELHVEELKAIGQRWRKGSVVFFPALAPDRVERYILGDMDTISPKRCLVPWTNATISANGLVCLCSAEPIGDVRGALFGAIYNGEAARSFRRALGSNTPARCGQCLRRFGDEDFRR